MDRISPVVLRSSQRGPRLLYHLGFGPLIGGLILLLTTTGRKSGLPRVTALQYEKVGDVYYVASFRGPKADWYRNLAVNPRALVQAGRNHFSASACLVCDPDRIVEFIRLRLKRRPLMVGMILRLDGIKPGDEEALRRYASNLALVILTPLSVDN